MKKYLTDRLKYKSFFCIIIISALLLSANVRADEPDRRGIRDEYAAYEDYKHYDREPVGSTGHYIVHGRGNWIEAEDGTDLFYTVDELSVFDEEFEIYLSRTFGIRGRLLTGDMKIFAETGGFDDYYLVRFDDFGIIAVPSGKNKKRDLTDAAQTAYYDTDGNLITDIDKYIRAMGAEPSDGVYTDKDTGEKKRFEKLIPIVGGLDLYYDKEYLAVYFGGTFTPYPRVRVGSTDRFICGTNVEETGIGGWIESEDGTDLFNYTRDFSAEQQTAVFIADADKELYGLRFYPSHGVDGADWIYDRDFNLIKMTPYGSHTPLVLTKSEEPNKPEDYEIIMSDGEILEAGRTAAEIDDANIDKAETPIYAPVILLVICILSELVLIKYIENQL